MAFSFRQAIITEFSFTTSYKTIKQRLPGKLVDLLGSSILYQNFFYVSSLSHRTRTKYTTVLVEEFHPTP